MNRVFAIILTLTIVFLLPLQVSAQKSKFPDVTQFHGEIELLTSRGVITGFNDGTFRPKANITRADAIIMLMRELKIPLNEVRNPNFKDLKPGDRGYSEIAMAVQLEIVSGKPGNIFDPKGTLTRGEMAKILAITYDLGGIFPYGFPDVAFEHWTFPYISALAANNITVGFNDGRFQPGLPITREHFSVFMARIVNPDLRPYNPKVADSFLEAMFAMEIIDYVAHPTDSIIFLLDAQENAIIAFNHETYDADYIQLKLPAEKIAYANGKLYATQLTGVRSPFIKDEDMRGAFAVIDATTMTLERIINIKLDPFDIAADDNGVVYISSGSAQWTSVQSFNSVTGEVLSTQGIRHRSYLAMHPDQNRLYSINTDSSPRTMRVYSINEGKLGPEIRSPYHGDYSLNQDIAITPDGKYIINSRGHFFRSTVTPSADMRYVATLDQTYSSIAFDVEYGEFYTSNKQNWIQAYDYITLRPIYQLTTYGNVEKMFYQNDILVIFSKVKLGNSPRTFIGIEKIYY
ncbi:S-layer homology domain-containing protein [Anaerobacillus isosaccharinicus]|uniref:S-layer homology domain-containing protein n=1 Tax=Anaerobacillus isosaccharinicus TaxID=1532552 RepID=A0A1S2L1G9_9BACI|nr:S-layer homology domain-containing protein [Anaerobacillus isosaccharinicus]MBA5584514.1 S-layer homology domain-containing protein [Anaerobacillus isosaccharinicus]QOY37102.1 S-layer homology domain-containing protein [Anaerobacillus isosaccharinicus]